MTGLLWMGLVLGLLLAGAIGLRAHGAKHRVRAERPAAAKAQGNNSPLTFFALVLVLSSPFWLIGAATDLQLIAGLPASALMAFCPMAAALLLVYRKHKTAGVLALLTRAFDFRRVKAKRWYIPVLFLMPGVSVVVYLLMHAMAMPLPAPQVTALPALLLLLAFFIGALGEELGWSGYALDPLQGRWAALPAGLILGGVALVWHLPPLLALHRAPAWIAWWCLYAVGSRILIVWLYNNTGESVFAVALFHATLNLSYVLFPVEGSHFDMRLGGLVTAFAATVVTFVWGPATLARYRQT